jgi:FKBP-type peptidyl-prolyl cis-trans isomerase FkpA
MDRLNVIINISPARRSHALGHARRSLPLIVALTLAVLTAGCGEAPTTASQFGAYSQTDIQVGTGTEAAANNTVTVNYTLWLYDGNATANKGIQLESSLGGTPLTFVLGSGAVIEGWDRGVPGMKVGGIRRLVIPPSLAYGQSRKGIVPQNATLLFDIELLEVTTSS